MRKRLICLILSLLLLSGCGLDSGPKQYTVTYLTLFDTVTTMMGRAESQEAFTETAKSIHDALLEYHRLFDIYNDYPGVNNLKTVNDQAGVAPVEVDRRIIDLLLDCKAYYDLTGGRVNVMMGSVLRLWHEARNESLNDPARARLPDTDGLTEAAAHMDIQTLIIDEEASTVYLSDPESALDVGAVAKGWSVQRVCETAPSGLLISVGGNVCATGPKDNSGTPWVVGVQDPDGGSDYLDTLNLTSGSVVTSGDYQRSYTVDGKDYHHIIDPDTLYPSAYWRSVTILCTDSGLADALSTALFLLPQPEGQRLLDTCGAEAIWVSADGGVIHSPDFTENIDK